MRLIGIIWISENAADVTMDDITDFIVVCQHFKTQNLYVVLKQTMAVLKLRDSDTECMGRISQIHLLIILN